MGKTLTDLRQQEYDLRLAINRLLATLGETNDPAAIQPLLDVIAEHQAQLTRVEEQHIALQSSDPQSGVLLAVRETLRHR